MPMILAEQQTRPMLCHIPFGESTGSTAKSTNQAVTLTADTAGTAWNSGRAAGPFTGPLGPVKTQTAWSWGCTVTIVSLTAGPNSWTTLLYQPTSGITLQFHADGRLQALTGEGAAATAAGFLHAGITYNVVVTHTGGTAVGAVTNLYINGALAATRTAASTSVAVDFSRTNQIGKGPTADPIDTRAYIDNVWAWEFELTAAEVALIYGVQPKPGTRALLADYSTGNFSQWAEIENAAYIGPPSGGVVAFDAQSATSSINSTAALSWTHTPVAGSGLNALVGFAVGKNASLSYTAWTTSVTYGGNAMTLLGVVDSGTGTPLSGFIALYGLTGCPAGPQTVVASSTKAATTPDSLIASCCTYTGVGAFATATTGVNVNTTDAPSSVVSSATNHRAVSVMCAGSSIAGNTQTQRYRNNLSVSSRAGNMVMSDAAGAATVTFAATANSDWWGWVGVDLT